MPSTTRQATSKMTREFDAWFKTGQESGEIDSDATKEEMMIVYCTLRVELVEQKAKEQAEQEAGVGSGSDETHVDDRLEQAEKRWEYREKQNDKKDERNVGVKRLKAQGAAIQILDGSDKGTLRGWINQIDCAGKIARTSEDELIMFALTKATGPLHSVIFTAFHDKHIDTWNEIRDTVSATLLTADEKAHLQAAVEKLMQRDDESVAAYCNRFRVAVSKAWCLEGVREGTDTFDLLMRKFIQSLCDDTTAWHVGVLHPQTLEEAFTIAQNSGRVLEARAEKANATDSTVAASDIAGKSKGVATAENATDRRERDTSSDQYIKTLHGDMKALKKTVVALQLELRNTSQPAAAPQQGGYGYTQRSGGYNNRRNFNQGRNQTDRNGCFQNNDNNRPAISQNQGVGGRPPMKCYGCGGDHPIRRCTKQAQNEVKPQQNQASGN